MSWSLGSRAKANSSPQRGPCYWEKDKGFRFKTQTNLWVWFRHRWDTCPPSSLWALVSSTNQGWFVQWSFKPWNEGNAFQLKRSGAGDTLGMKLDCLWASELDHLFCRCPGSAIADADNAPPPPPPTKFQSQKWPWASSLNLPAYRWGNWGSGRGRDFLKFQSETWWPNRDFFKPRLPSFQMKSRSILPVYFKLFWFWLRLRNIL